jgi:hypothetical protein
MANLILNGDSRGAVKALADVATGQKKVTQEVDHSIMRVDELRRRQKQALAEVSAELKKQAAAQEAVNRKQQAGVMFWHENSRKIAESLRNQNAEQTKVNSGLDGMMGAFGRLASAGTIISGLASSFREMREDIDKARIGLTALGAAGELQQVATSERDFHKLMGQARGFIRQGVFSKDQEAQAFDLTFALRNALYSDSDVDFITKLGVSRQVKPENMVQAAEGLAKYRDVFGSREAGSIQQIANKVFTAAGSMQTDFAKAASTATLFGSEAEALKFDDESALAAFVAIEKSSPGPEEAATRLRSLLTQVAKKKLSKGTMSDTIASLVDRVRAGESAIDITGEIRAAAGLNILAKPESMGVYRDQLGQIRAANAKDVIGSRQFFKGDPELSAADALQRETGLTTDALRPSAKVAALADAVNQARKRKAYEKYGDVGVWLDNFGEWGLGWVDFANSPRSTIAGEARGGFRNVTPDTASEIMRELGYTMEQQRAVLERIARSNDEMNRKTRNTPVNAGRQE